MGNRIVILFDWCAETLLLFNGYRGRFIPTKWMVNIPGSAGQLWSSDSCDSLNNTVIPVIYIKEISGRDQAVVNNFFSTSC